MTREKSFWMVYVYAGDGPRVIHETLEEAKKEAERLCRKVDGEVYVLEAVWCAKLADAPIEWTAIVQGNG